MSFLFLPEDLEGHVEQPDLCAQNLPWEVGGFFARKEIHFPSHWSTSLTSAFGWKGFAMKTDDWIISLSLLELHKIEML